ncbi:MAG: hypothetical protein ACTSRI_21840 [Promethearchaeota archaeon]
MLDIKDHVLGGTLYQISKRYGMSTNSIYNIANMVFREKIQEYQVRFLNQKILKHKINLAALDVLKLNVNERNFSNLLSEPFQKMLNERRKEKKLNYLFRSLFIDLEFAEWVNDLPDTRIEKINDGLLLKSTKRDLLELCFKTPIS